MMLCSILSLFCAVRSRMVLLEPLPVLEIDAEEAVLFPQRHHRPVAVQIPLHAHDLLVGVGQVGDVRHRDVARDLLLDGQAQPGRVGLNAASATGRASAG